MKAGAVRPGTLPISISMRSTGLRIITGPNADDTNRPDQRALRRITKRVLLFSLILDDDIIPNGTQRLVDQDMKLFRGAITSGGG